MISDIALTIEDYDVAIEAVTSMLDKVRRDAARAYESAQYPFYTDVDRDAVAKDQWTREGDRFTDALKRISAVEAKLVAQRKLLAKEQS